MKFRSIHIPRQIYLLLILVVFLSLARILLFGSYAFVYLLWNVFLAIVPFAFSSVLFRLYEEKNLPGYVFCISVCLWLVCIPNAPYIVTDMIHIGQGVSVPALYDSFMIFSAAWIGISLFAYSVSHIERIFLSYYSKRRTNAIIGCLFMCISFGMYLGRFLRFNSWDIVAAPVRIIASIGEIIFNPIVHAEAYFYTLLFFIFISLAYLAHKSAR